MQAKTHHKQKEPVLKQIVKCVHNPPHYTAQHLAKGESFVTQKIAQEHNCTRPSGGLCAVPISCYQKLQIHGR